MNFWWPMSADTSKLKRFLVFAFAQYYPNGGFNDFVDSFDSIEEAQKESKKQKEYGVYLQIIDIETGEEVSDER